MKNIFKTVAALVAFTLVASCGGSSSDSTSSSGIRNMSEIPLDVVDPSAYGTSAAISASMNTPKAAISKNVNAVGDFSVAGCMSDKMKRNVIRNAMRPKAILCYIKTIGDKLGMTIGDNAYNYYTFDFPGDGSGEGVAGNMKIAIGNFGAELRMSVCSNDVKFNELKIDTTEGKYVGSLIDIENGRKSKLSFDADGTPDNYTTANFSQISDEEEWGYHAMAIEATPASDVVYGRQDDNWEDRDIVRAMYSKFDFDGTAKAGGGKAVFSETGTEPSVLVSAVSNMNQQWYEYLTNEEWGLGLADTQRFCMLEQEPWMSLTASETCTVERGGEENYAIGDPLLDLIDRFTVAATSAYDAEVTSSLLDDIVATTEDIGFEETDVIADCTADFIDPGIAVTEDDIADCNAIMQEANNWQDEGDCWQAAEEQRRQNEQQ